MNFKILSFIFLAAALLSAQNEPELRKETIQKYAVESAAIYMLSPDWNGNEPPDSLLYTLHYYDKAGNKITSIIYDKGEPVAETEWNYDVNGNLILEAEYDEQGTAAVTRVFSYEDGLLVKSASLHPLRDTLTCSLYDYFNDNRMRVEWRYEDGGYFIDRTVTSYNDEGKILEELVYSPDAELLAKTVFTYDDQGNITSVTSFLDSELEGEKTELMYDERELLISEIDFNEDGSIRQEITYHYNDDGDLIEEKFFDAEGNLFERFEYTYYKVHLPKTIVSYWEDSGPVLKYYFEYLFYEE